MKTNLSNTLRRVLMAVVVMTATAVLLLPCGAKEPGRIAVQETPDGVLFTENGQKVLFYQKTPKSLDGRFTRAHYVHPLYDLDGEELSEDFPADHRHHRGIFSAWHQLFVGDTALGDAWSLKDFSYDVQEVRILKTNTASAAASARVFWKSPLWKDSEGREKPFVEETQTILVHPAAENHRKIDFEIRLSALEDDFRIGGSADEKGYGGFSVRVRLPKDVVFTGANGPVQPTVTPVASSPWMDISGTFTEGKKIEGVGILCHPSLPNFPQPWILRRQRSMQNPVYPGANPVPLPRDKPLTLRYRLVLHRGDAAEARIADLQKEYENEPLPVLAP